MERADFERMVATLEAKSRQAPAAYQINVALLALLGFAILAFIVGMAGAGIVVLVGLPFALWYGGLHSVGLLAGLGKLLLLLVVPLWLLVKSSLSAVLTRFPAPQGLELTRRQAPALFAALDDMRRRMKGPRFHHVLVTEELNAAVVQRPLFGLVGPARNHLILGLPLLDSLSPEEATAVVAHEYGHLAGSHGHFGAFIYRLRAGWATVQAVSQLWKGMAGRLLQRLIAWYAPYFNAYSFVLARSNEYQADAASAELVGAEVIARALARTDVNGAHYSRFMQQTFRTAATIPQPPEDLALRWAAVAQEAPQVDARRWLERALAEEGGVGDTHPPLRQRLSALVGEAAASSAEVPAPIEGPTAAEAWLGTGAAAVRHAMQLKWRERVTEPWKQRHEEMQEKRRRLLELRANARPSQDEHVERLRLQVDLGEEEGFTDDVSAFISAYPGNAMGPYLDGVWRLQRDDGSGLECLERAMAVDRDAIKPACERAFEHLNERNDPRAADYRRRWNEREEWEQRVAPQLQRLDIAHELRAAGLPADVMDKVSALLRAHRDGVARAFLARRVLPADPSVETYVLGLELEPAPPRLETGGQIVERMAGTGGWPMHVLVFAIEGIHAGFKARLRGLPGAELSLEARRDQLP